MQNQLVSPAVWKAAQPQPRTTAERGDEFAELTKIAIGSENASARILYDYSRGVSPIPAIRLQEMVTVRQLARLRGKLNFLRVVTPQASFYLMEISKVINQEINKFGWDRNRIIPMTILKELEWWRYTISINKPLNFIISDREAVITTDASKIGWGATLILPNQRESEKESGNWNKTEMNMSSNLKETTAVYLSLKKFNNQILKKQSQRRSATSLANATQMIIALAENNQYKIRAKHIPWRTNTEADSLSRLSRCGDYALKQEILDNAMKEMNKQITIDAFANRKNRKTQRFYSINRDVWAEARDGLDQSWEGELPLVHPPIMLLGRCLNKINRGNLNAVVVCPIWKAQNWFPLFQEITIQQKDLGMCEDILEIGEKMQARGLKLPPGRLGIFLVKGKGKSSSSTAQLQLESNMKQLNQQQRTGNAHGKDTAVDQQNSVNT
ncbi:MAG: putative reverse transcriptase [Streblomastix strix]|uniref:Putative reverse transcriptase n=1 Tax=Streblomastix strix TaxID=222440 RepID=A0A5J4VN88_9EUKA|nr:MAG: putative reverse transcriptase [Streblomastix strix]